MFSLRQLADASSKNRRAGAKFAAKRPQKPVTAPPNRVAVKPVKNAASDKRDPGSPEKV